MSSFPGIITDTPASLSHERLVVSIVTGRERQEAISELAKTCIDGACELAVPVLESIENHSPQLAFDVTRSLIRVVRGELAPQDTSNATSENADKPEHDELAPLLGFGHRILTKDAEEQKGVFTEADRDSFVSLAYDFEPEETEDLPTDPVERLRYRMAKTANQADGEILKHAYNLLENVSREEFLHFILSYPGKKNTGEQDLINLLHDFAVIVFAEQAKTPDDAFRMLDRFSVTDEGKEAIDTFHDRTILHYALREHLPWKKLKILNISPRTDWGKREVAAMRARYQSRNSRRLRGGRGMPFNTDWI